MFERTGKLKLPLKSEGQDGVDGANRRTQNYILKMMGRLLQLPLDDGLSLLEIQDRPKTEQNTIIIIKIDSGTESDTNMDNQTSDLVGHGQEIEYRRISQNVTGPVTKMQLMGLLCKR